MKGAKGIENYTQPHSQHSYQCIIMNSFASNFDFYYLLYSNCMMTHNSLYYNKHLFNTPFTLQSQNCSSLSRTVPSGSVNGHFLSRTVPLWKGKAFDSRTVPKLFHVGVNTIFPRTVPGA